MKWLNEPKNWFFENDVLKVDVDGGTDFWRVTHYDFIRDNGHFFYRDQDGDFAAKVVTRDFSDWSVVQRSDNPEEVWFRLRREKDFVEIGYSLDGDEFTMLRLAYFPPTVPVQIGLMCAAPDGDGFPIEFENFSIQD